MIRRIEEGPWSTYKIEYGRVFLRVISVFTTIQDIDDKLVVVGLVNCEPTDLNRLLLGRLAGTSGKKAAPNCTC